MAKIVRRYTKESDPFIPFYCKVYVVQHNDSFYLYLTSRIHKKRLHKHTVSYSLEYLQSKPLFNDSDYIKFISRFK